MGTWLTLNTLKIRYKRPMKEIAEVVLTDILDTKQIDEYFNTVGKFKKTKTI